MPRTARIAPGGIIYHVLNRGVGRTTLFRSRKDYQAFQRCMIQTLEAVPMRILGYCIMPNHFHLILWPKKDGDLARFMMRLTNMHVRRWLTFHEQVGRRRGPLRLRRMKLSFTAPHRLCRRTMTLYAFALNGSESRMRQIRTSGSMSGTWKRSASRQRATSRLHLSEFPYDLLTLQRYNSFRTDRSRDSRAARLRS
jgi:REP element-mobilizing transposase RayT